MCSFSFEVRQKKAISHYFMSQSTFLVMFLFLAVNFGGVYLALTYYDYFRTIFCFEIIIYIKPTIPEPDTTKRSCFGKIPGPIHANSLSPILSLNYRTRGEPTGESENALSLSTADDPSLPRWRSIKSSLTSLSLFLRSSVWR